jgi:2-C-methyl-D-erythritol 4-phosphate cytidylyltransferase
MSKSGMKVVAIVASAGLGRRLNKKIAKPLVILNGKPILIHTLKNLSKSSIIEEIIIAVDKNYLEIFKKKIKQFGLSKVKKIVAGGKTRGQSVFNGLRAIDKDFDIVLIHDGARPFIKTELIKKLVSQAKKFGAAILAVPAKATIKRIDPKKLEVVATLNRNILWEVQTPQAFKKDLILSAFKKLNTLNLTDDAALVERLGKKVKVVLGSYDNIKITTPEDLVFAEGIAKKF